MKQVTIYTDGSAKGNPDGPGGYGAIIEYVGKNGKLFKKELSAGYKKTTNNRMELMGVIRAIECLNTSCRIDVYSDSQYLVNAFNKGWLADWERRNWIKSDKKPVKIMDLWKKLLSISKPHEITYHWVKGHAGNPQNERCDALATSAAEGGSLLDDVELS